jgi:hypothetical protein
MRRTVAFHVPDEVAEAVRHEALREMRRPGDVLAEFLRWGWPSFVKERLSRDLGIPIEADSADAPALKTTGRAP